MICWCFDVIDEEKDTQRLEPLLKRLNLVVGMYEKFCIHIYQHIVFNQRVGVMDVFLMVLASAKKKKKMK